MGSSGIRVESFGNMEGGVGVGIWCDNLELRWDRLGIWWDRLESGWDYLEIWWDRLDIGLNRLGI